jgi:Site-specific recombinase XerD
VIAGVHYVKKPRKNGPPCWYVYAYRGGPQIARHIGWQRPKLSTSELRRLIEAAKPVVIEPQPTLRSLIRAWRPASPDWTSLAATTQKTWGSALDRIEEKWGDTPLTVWADPRMTAKVVAWRDSRADTPRGADIGVVVLRALLEFGRLRGQVPINVASRIPKLYKGGARASIIWSYDEIERFASAAAELGVPHIADGVKLAALTGLRRADLVSLTWDEILPHAIQKKAAKISKGKRRFAVIPRIPELDAHLELLRGRMRKSGVNNVLVNSRGVAWSGDGFGTSFNRVRDYARIVHVDDETGRTTAKHIHDLRGTFCTKLLRAGLSNEEVAEIMGWAPDQVAGIRRSYVDQSAIVRAIGERISGTL